MTDLNNFYKKIYSQSGEDGVLEKIFETLNIEKGWFCEFGAGDGNLISNTRLLREKGWSGVLIEGDSDLFNQLTSSDISLNKNIYTINKYISCEKGEKIDNLLSSTPIPKDFDLVSIDVDGNDLWIWKSMKKYKPKVVIIEYNSHFPVHESLTIEYDKNHRFESDRYYGASAGALIKLGKEKGYDLIGYTNGLNLVFIDSSIKHSFMIMDPSLIEVNIGWKNSEKNMISY